MGWCMYTLPTSRIRIFDICHLIGSFCAGFQREIQTSKHGDMFADRLEGKVCGWPFTLSIKRALFMKVGGSWPCSVAENTRPSVEC